MRYTQEQIQEALRNETPLKISPIDVRWDAQRQTVIVNLGKILGEIPLAELTFKQYDRVRDYYPEVEELYQKEFPVMVIGQDVKGNFILSRTAYISKAIKTIKVGEIYEGTVVSVAKGFFFANVEGLIVMVPGAEASTTYMEDMKDFFACGEKMKIKILSKQEEAPYHIRGSRRQAAPKPIINTGDVIRCRIVRKVNDEGFYCEITPNLHGIIDVNKYQMRSMRVGESYYGVVKEINMKGLKLDMF